MNTLLSETPGTIDEQLDWALEKGGKLLTFWNQIEDTFGKKREVIVETPRAGAPDGKDVQHVDSPGTSGADTQTILTKAGEIINQVKGLLGIGYPQTVPQPVSGVQTELGGLAGLSMGTLAIIGLILYLMTRK